MVDFQRFAAEVCKLGFQWVRPSVYSNISRPGAVLLSCDFDYDNLCRRSYKKINTYRAPRDKLVCILNCCKVINNLLTFVSAKDNPPGADGFLPVLIYVTIKVS
ncbi:hypothetical protein RDI58_002544 [Solanum bulbocastanum]|uniref:VPS9 domain-containing protein n=1 Tax=Solanum bulbocastanum TaxID=147425 RepID=A0AAN8UEJ9_SOLBU